MLRERGRRREINTQLHSGKSVSLPFLTTSARRKPTRSGLSVPSSQRHFWEEIQYRDPLVDHIHASIPGHRFDFLLHQHDTRPIRSTYTDSGRIEGWGFYCEEMMLQAGILKQRPRTRELFYIAQLARAARIPAELKIQRGELL